MNTRSGVESEGVLSPLPFCSRLEDKPKDPQTCGVDC